MKNKKALSLILALVVIVALGAAYYFISQNNDQTEKPTAEETVALNSLDGTITQISYKAADGEMLNLKFADDRWQWEGDSEFPLRQARPQNMVKALTPLKAKTKVVDEAENPADFGLNQPQNIITVANDAGQQMTYILGSSNSHTGDYYLQIEGESAIYSVDAEFAETFSYNLHDMLRTDMWPIIQNTEVHTVSIKNAVDDFTIDIESATAEDGVSVVRTYHVSTASGQSFIADQMSGEQMLALLPTLIVYDCVTYKASEEDLAQYGLDNPVATISVNYTQIGSETPETTTLYCGSTKDDKTFVRFEGSKAVNLISTNSLKNYLSLQAANLMP